MNLPKTSRVHIVGVCGTLMGAFAAYLKKSGYQVSGSDQNVYPPMSDVLKNAGVTLLSPYSYENLSGLDPSKDIIVIGNTISAKNPESIYATQNKFKIYSLPALMEDTMLPTTKNFVVAGTHGKTTTSSWLAFALKHAGRDPNYFIGGVSLDLPESFVVSSLESGRPFVLEGDEYDTAYWDKVPKFSHYLPDHVLLNAIEYDHADIYPNLEAYEAVFIKLLKSVRAGGSVIACLDFPSTVKVLASIESKSSFRLTTYSKDRSHPQAQVVLKEYLGLVDGAFISTWLDRRSQSEFTLRSQMPGEHNALNACAVYLACVQEAGLSSLEAIQGVAEFRGVKRRQEVRGVEDGVTVIDDFAHHPTAVIETIKALRSKYPRQRLTVVFEPRNATSRRKIFQKEYVEAFLGADQVFIAHPYEASKIPEDQLFSSDQLVDDLKMRRSEAHLLPSHTDEQVEAIQKNARSGDVIAVMSNGGFGGLIPKLLDVLKKRKA